MAGGSPKAPGSSKTVGELGAPPVVPSNPNSRRGRSARSPIRQGRVAMDTIIVGIDVSKDRLDVAVRPEWGGVCRSNATPAAWSCWWRGCKPLAPHMVALEATGGFETVAAAALAAAGSAGGGRQPGPGSRLRQGDRPARQDRSDRRRRHRPLRRGDQARSPRPLPDEATRLLADLVARRRQIIEMIGAERQREKRATATHSRRASRGSSRRWRRNSPASTATSTTPCAARRPGARRRICWPPCPASGRSSPAP